MAVKRYDGSAWQTVAGLGAQGPAATSSSIATWVKTASGGETSLSGNDDSSQALSYTVGQELVFINGTLLKRGSDYTATNGTSITGLTALAANDVATVWTVNAFSVTGAIANTIVDAKGDLIVATGADTPGRLAVGSANQVLTVDSSTGTGLKWATPASGSTYVGCSLYSNANQSISNATATAINFQVEQFDTDTFHDNSTNNTRITIPAGKAGKYVLSAQLGWVSQGIGTKQIRLYKNGSMIAINAFNNTDTTTGLNIRYTVNAAVSDYYELYAYQDSGTARDIYAAAAETYFIADYLGA